MHAHRSFTTLIILALPAISLAAEPIRLSEQFPAGYQYHVSSRVDLTGSLKVPAEDDKKPRDLAMTGSSVIEYDERVLAVENNQVQKTLRIYRQVELKRQLGDQPQESNLRPAVRRLVLLRKQNTEVPFSPDGPLTWGEIDLVRTDVFTPALAGLLPAGAVRPGDRWKATAAAIAELTDMETVEEGELGCQLEEITTFSNRRHAKVALSGTVKGVNEDGKNQQQLEGHYYFDLESSHLSYVSFKGIHILLDKDSKETGRVEGRFVLTRQAPQRSRELADEAIKGVKLDPSEDNTLLLYENADLGVQMLHARRWRIGGVQGRQVTLEDANGNGMLLTVESLARMPTAAQYLEESRKYLEGQKGRIVRSDGPNGGGGVEHFSMEVEMSGQRALMEYYVVRQAQGGATIAARLLPTDQAGLQADVDRIVRSIRITAEQK